MDSQVQQLEQVRARLEALESHSQRLRTQNRAIKGAFLGCLVALALVLLARQGPHGYADDRKEKVVEATRFVLRDGKDRIRAAVWLGEHGPKYDLYDEDGHFRAALALGRSSSPTLAFGPGSGQVNLVLTSLPRLAALVVLGSKGNVNLSHGPDGTALVLEDRHDNKHLLLVQDEHGAELAVFDTKWRKRLNLTLEAGSPHGRIIDEKGDLVSAFPVPPAKAADPILASHQALVPADALGFLTSNSLEMARSKLGERVRKSLGTLTPAPDDTETTVQLHLGALARQTHFWTAGAGPVTVNTTTARYDHGPLLKKLGGQLVERQFRGQRYHLLTKTSYPHQRPAFLFLNDRTFVQGSEEGVREVLVRAPAVRAEGPLTPLWALVPLKSTCAGGIKVPAPPDRGPAPGFLEALYTNVLAEIRPASGLAFRIEFEPAPQVHLRLPYPDREAARRALALWKRRHTQAREALAALPAAPEPGSHWRRTHLFFKRLETAFAKMTLKQEGAIVHARVPFEAEKLSEDFFGELTGFLLELVGNVRNAAARIHCSNNLKQIVLATHNWADSHGGKLFGPAIYSKEGKPLLSWRVALLPYLEQDALYKQFRLDEPWDSPHNKKLLPLMPSVYAPVVGKTKQPYSTYFRVFTGPETLFDPKTAGRGLPPLGSWKINAIPDGSSNTILVVEAAEAVPWTKPDELVFDPRKPLPKLGGQFPGGFLVALADGSVRQVGKTTSEKTVKAAITANGGEVLGADW